ncbi:hypothetical protein GCM10009634_61160 [Saccharothrix xinjiangensis]
MGAFVLGQLPPEQEPAVRAHVDGCLACRTEVVELRPVAELLRLVDPDRVTGEAPVPPHLGELVVSRVRAERRRRVPRWGATAAAAVLVSLVSGGIGWYAGQPSLPLEPVAVQAGAGVRARAALVPHTWGVEIKLTASGFTAGRAYRVVVTDREGREASAGAFVGTGDAPMTCNLNSSVLRGDATRFAVLGDDGEVVLTASL